VSALSLTVAVVRLKLAVARYRARRAALRMIRRAVDWLEPAG
jgi:hypothetical protein